MSKVDVATTRPLNQFLRMAVIAGVESAVQIHIERGDDLNARDANGMTPLMLSAARNRPTICKLLLSAGADRELTDPSGRNAFDIAVANGSRDAAEILRAVSMQIEASPASQIALDSNLGHKIETSPIVICNTVPLDAPAIAPAILKPQSLPKLTAEAAEVMDDEAEFDLSCWETEVEPTRPASDLVIVDSASAIHRAISSHMPVDSSAAWDDIDAYLPQVALLLASSNNTEVRALLRRLLLRAIREGSVPCLDVEAQSTNEDGSANPEAEGYLAMVINDLGAEIDERVEYSCADESFEVFVNPSESPEEEATLDEALAIIDRAASPRYVPMAIYQREIQRLRLLTAEEEIQLAQGMEASLDAALDALAAWPEGIARTLAAGAEAIAGSRPLSSVWIGSADLDQGPASESNLNTDDPAIKDLEGALDDKDEQTDDALDSATDSVFAEALQRLAALVKGNGARAPLCDIRQALATLRLNRRFLLELIDVSDKLAPSADFAHAINRFRKAHERMATGNLKLALFVAKKYLYSGEPLDDLAQEGNIGLLKAIDRYDWRRGFRFSTYATWWIRQQISRYVADKARTIRIPVHVYEKAHRVEREAQAFKTEFGREPTVDELANRVEMSSHKLTALFQISPEPSCIDDLAIDEIIAIDARDTYASPDPMDVVEELQMRLAVDRFVSSLSTKNDKEEQILRLRFGIGLDEGLTLEEVGIRFGVTRERIRQVEAKAIRKLMHPSRSGPFARLALGFEPKQDSFGPDEKEAVGAGAIAERKPMHQAVRHPLIEAIPRADTLTPPSLDRLLAQAANLTIAVEDERTGETGQVGVSLVATPDTPHRVLAHELFEFGLEHDPEKGN